MEITKQLFDEVSWWYLENKFEGPGIHKQDCHQLKNILLETFKFKDKDDYEYKIWLKVFLHILKINTPPESFILPFFTRSISTVTFSEGLQNDKTSNIW